MHPISVVIITYNEERNIGRCLDSVQGLADEIVVVDSFSTDATEVICKQYGVRFVQQAFLGYVQQKKMATTQATYSFILSLDADEALSLELYAAIAAVKKTGFTKDVYLMNRCTNFGGRWIKHGTWYPDKKLRLFNREKAAWAGTNPHDKITINSNSSVGKLNGNILHYSYNTIEELVTQANKFTTIQALAMHNAGKKTSVMKIIINPWWAFINGYIFKLGFLDGRDGYLIASTVAYQTMLKYSKLLNLQKQEQDIP